MEFIEIVKKRLEAKGWDFASDYWDDEELSSFHEIILETEAALRQQPVSGSLLSAVDYWKQRCLLAEKYLAESPCDPDATSDQIKAWNAYHKFISWAGNDP